MQEIHLGEEGGWAEAGAPWDCEASGREWGQSGVLASGGQDWALGSSEGTSWGLGRGQAAVFVSVCFALGVHPKQCLGGSLGAPWVSQ